MVNTEKLKASIRNNPLFSPGIRTYRKIKAKKRFTKAYFEDQKEKGIALVKEMETVPFKEVLQRNMPDGSDSFNRINLAMVEINNTCNINCTKCETKLTTRKKGLMKDDQFEKALDELEAVGINNVSLHTLGDPLSNPNLGHYLKRLGERNFRTNISSNGLPLDKNIDTLLANMHVCSSLRLSIDGITKEVYESMHAGGKFEHIQKNLELFKEKLAPHNYYLTLHMVISKENMGQVGDWIEGYRSYVLLPHADLSFYFLTSIAPKNDYFNAANVFPNHTYLRDPCWLVTQPNAQILIDGSVSVCCQDYDGSLIVGNINEQSLDEIYQGEKMEKVRDAHLKEDLSDYAPCRNCYLNDERVSAAFATLMRNLLFNHPTETASFYQDRVDRFIELFQKTTDLAEPYSKLFD